MKIPTFEDYQNYKGLHCHKLWADVGENWICPACSRNKFQILRWTTRNPGKQNAFKAWVAVLHRHHDHSQGYWSVNLGRFPETVICDQCNSADGTAKRKLGLPRNFSFAPEEIALFISASPHGRHKIDFELAKAIYIAINIGSIGEFHKI
jgi:hypothetical protein